MSEMATAVLNGLTNNRHSTFMQKLGTFEEKEAKKSGPKTKKESSTVVGGEEKKADDSKKANSEGVGETVSSGSTPLGGTPLGKAATEGALVSADGGPASETSSLQGPKSDRGSVKLGHVSMGSASREVSLEPSNSSMDSVELKCEEYGLEQSKSTEPGSECTSRDVSVDRSASREISLERSRSREISLERLQSDRLASSKGSSKSREVSTERSMPGSASPHAPNSKVRFIKSHVEYKLHPHGISVHYGLANIPKHIKFVDHMLKTAVLPYNGTCMSSLNMPERIVSP